MSVFWRAVALSKADNARGKAAGRAASVGAGELVADKGAAWRAGQGKAASEGTDEHVADKGTAGACQRERWEG